MIKMNVDYEQLLAYYEQVPQKFWIQHWRNRGKYHADSFKVSYQFSLGQGHAWERYYIEAHLFEELIKKDK